MMNTQNILEYLEDSKDFNESTVEQFEEILSEYPYIAISFHSFIRNYFCSLKINLYIEYLATYSKIIILIF